ncbi:MAG: glycosyltransferase family 61 protein [Hyphomicrobiales bacterium]|nr:MAG: glycosyltransferase family 61 protein [Hyphomicrobiales bacterium]
MRIDLGRFVQKQRGNLRKFARELPAPIRRQLFYARGFGAGPMGLPRLPWKLAESDPDPEIVATFEGAFEPPKKARVFGPNAIVPRFVPLPKSTPLRIRRFENIILLPHHVMLDKHGHILPASLDLMASSTWLTPAHQRGSMNYEFDGDVRAAQAVDEPVFVADCMHEAFGHTLMETIPKLAMLGGAPEGIKVATSARLYPALIEGMGVAMERVLPIRGPLFCKIAYVPDAPLDLTGNFHAVARAAFGRLEALATQSAVEPKRRIYLSRAGVKFRRLHNETDVEALVRRYGFEVVRPEGYSIPDQIKLMLNADMVIGPTGSNTHNLVYARPETKALLLSSAHWFVDIDAYVSKADWQFAHVIGTPAPRRFGEDERSRSWTIDTGAVEQAIREHFGLMPA